MLRGYYSLLALFNNLAVSQFFSEFRMSATAPTLLFIPVSSQVGMGEYMRSLCIANEFKRRYPSAEIHFILNKAASYLADCPFTVHKTEQSPTKCSNAVNEIVNKIRPDVAIFDASGRVSQLRCCKRLKVSTLYIAQHQKKLARALSIRRLRFTDKIVVAQPKFVMAELSLWARLKVRLLGKRLPEFVGPVFSPRNIESEYEVLQSLNLIKNNYILVNAGGGGNRVSVEGKVSRGHQSVSAADIFLEASLQISKVVSYPIVVVLGKNFNSDDSEWYAKASACDKVRLVNDVPMQDFITLAANAKAALLSGGGSLLQAVALGVKTIIAVPISSDQHERISACEGYGLCSSSSPDAKAIVTKVVESLEQDVLPNQSGCIAPLVENGLESVLETTLSLIK